MFYKAGKKVVAYVLSGMMLCSWNGIPVHAEAAESSAGTVTVSESAETEALTADAGDSSVVQTEEGSSRVLLPSAGFSYSFSANKVSLSDVKNNLDSSSAGGAASSDTVSGSSEETQTSSGDGKSISETSLTPVQKQEQSVVSAVSQTQGIEIDNATATILSATAVTVVSDAQTAVSLAKLADKKQTQAKLDQGVISASEAEALMAASEASSSVKVDNVSAASGEETQGETVVIAIPAAAGAETANAAGGTEDAAAAGTAADAAGTAGTEASDAAGTVEAVSGEGSGDAATGSTGLWEKIPEDEMVTAGANGSASADASANGSSQSASADTAAAEGTAAEETSSTGTAASVEKGDAAAQDTTETASEEAAAASTEQSSDAASSASGSSVPTDSEGNEIVVAQVDSYINIRADASQDADIIGKLYNGSVAHVLGRTGNGWARVQSGGVTGFIREEYVATGSTAQQLADAVSTKQAVVSTMTLRVRAAAEADSDVITLVGEGQTLDILEEVDGWYKINTPDGVGYISADFADAEEVYPEAVSKEQEEAEEAARKAEEEAANAASSDSAASPETGSSSSSDSASSGSEGSSSSGGSLNTYSGSSASGTTAGQAVVNYALQFVGNPYVWGGSSLTNGTDCSGFTMAVYANFGYSLPHYTGSQMSCGTAVASLDEAQPGDLILYNGHVGIYMGNNQIVHASNPRTGITTGTATYRHIVAIRRIIN